MSKLAKYAGIDVHKDSLSIVVAEGGHLEPRFRKRISGCNARLPRVLRTLGALEYLHCAYETGPTGYGIHRLLTERGVRCEVWLPRRFP